MQDKLKKHPAFTHTKDIIDICNPLQLLGITAFSHIQMDQQGNFTGLANKPEFMENYLRKKYFNADVHIKKNDFNVPHCLLWDAIVCDGASEEMLQDAYHYHFRHIFTLIKTENGISNFYHFGSDQENPAINQVYINHQDLLEKFIPYFHTRMQESPALMKTYNIHFQVEENAAGIELKNPVTAAPPNQQVRENFIKAIHKKPYLQEFSPRQLQCAKLLLTGCTAPQIAAQLGISPRTAEEHIALIKEKLQVQNKTALLMKLMQIF